MVRLRSKLGLYCGDVEEAIQQLLPIGMKTPTSMAQTPVMIDREPFALSDGEAERGRRLMTISHRRWTKIVWAAKAWVGYARGPDGGRSAKGAELWLARWYSSARAGPLPRSARVPSTSSTTAPTTRWCMRRT